MSDETLLDLLRQTAPYQAGYAAGKQDGIEAAAKACEEYRQRVYDGYDMERPATLMIDRCIERIRALIERQER
jgi:hypothetical protein